LSLADINAILDIVTKSIPILEKLNTARTVLLKVENETPYTLRLQSHEHAHGDFAEPPDFNVPPGQVSIFGSQSRAGSVATGTEGRVIYGYEGVDDQGRPAPDGYQLEIYWDNPWVGGNSCDINSRLGFRGQAVSGGSNDAEMKYNVRYDPRVHNF
jgi:hypothetical protein